MTDRITATFARCKAEGRAALMIFVTAGDPDVPTSLEVLETLVRGGADIIEIGMPFTDPMADGVAIQKANLRSLGNGIRTQDILDICTQFRARHPDVPLVLMGYANPMTIRGAEWFADRVSLAGVDGVICVDIPPEEDADLGPALRARGVHMVRLATPTTDAKRLPKVLDGASGFVYHVAVAGITGAQSAAAADVAAAVARLKAATTLPVAVGFGVRTPEQAAAIARHADGVIVGSAVVSLIGEGGPDLMNRIETLISGLAGAMQRRVSA